MKILKIRHLILVVAITIIAILACSKNEPISQGTSINLRYNGDDVPMNFAWYQCQCTTQNGTVYSGQRCEVTIMIPNCTRQDAELGCICKTRDKVIYDKTSKLTRNADLTISELDSVIEILNSEPITKQVISNHYRVFYFLYTEGILEHPDTLIKYSIL
ncbi:MAG TPA: hypothetical protein PLK75_04370 [Bacteroidales bacterium]|nr:hypothetical protein [Bacteroidales bacterium]